MCRIQKKRVLLKWFCGLTAVGLLIGICLALKDNQKKSGLCRIGKYKNLEIPLSERKELTEEERKKRAESLCEQTGIEQTEENRKKIVQALVQEQIYEMEMEKRRAVLFEIFKHSTMSDEVEDPEETLLLTVYKKEGLTLTEEEKRKGINNLQDVFGAADEEELGHFLSADEVLRIIKKEKTYEYLLENNRFVTVPAVVFP